jgi:hypothetical protein
MSAYTSTGAALFVASAIWLVATSTSREIPSPQVRDEVDRPLPVRLHVSRDAELRERPRAPEPADTPTGAPTTLVSTVRAQGLPGAAASAIWDAMATYVIGEDELLSLLDRHCDIQTADVPDGVPVLEHAAGVARLGARGVVTEQEFYANDFEAQFPAAVEFAAATDESNAAVSPVREFSATTRKIFATFASESIDGRHVLVKWTDLQRSRVYVCGKYAIEPHADHSFVWLEMKHDWLPGAYAVEVYAMNDDLAPIAGGRYVVR